MLMTVNAADPMDIVSASGAGECRVHFLDIDAAMRHLRVAGFAGGCRVLVVPGMASEAADSLVNADGSAIVARADLWAIVICCSGCARFGLARRVALVAKRLPRIGTDLHRARTV